ncbi:VOC family protein [Haladaptatus sp. DYF46]|uniref:VOC family protein n=1 Tax=Haladaptatus sp. DYF46 TaxID=2886041 RepID=UPI001E65632C
MPIDYPLTRVISDVMKATNLWVFLASSTRIPDMGISGVHHLVLLVDDVPDGEAYYQELFDMDVLFREGTLNGEPGTVPDTVTWDEALAKDVTPYMSFLGRNDFFLAVAEADKHTTERQVDHVALDVDEESFEAITSRAESLGCEVERNAPFHRTFHDNRGFEWELNTHARPPERAFETLDLE